MSGGGDQGARSCPPPGVSRNVVGKRPRPRASMVTLARRILEALDADPPMVNRARWFAEELELRAVERAKRAANPAERVAS